MTLNPSKCDRTDAQQPHHKGRDKWPNPNRLIFFLLNRVQTLSIYRWHDLTSKDHISRIKGTDNNSNQSNLISNRPDPP
jgi:hypothetical protein